MKNSGKNKTQVSFLLSRRPRVRGKWIAGSRRSRSGARGNTRWPMMEAMIKEQVLGIV